MITDRTFHEWFIPTLAGRLKISSYLEIGLYHGDTIMAVKKIRPHAHCIGVDRVHVELEGVTVFDMDSARFWRECAVGWRFDMIFIDADHSADAAREDFARAWEHITAEGLVILHDTNPHTVGETAPGYSGDCWKFAQELHARGFEAVTLPFNPGLTIVRNRVHWGPK